MLRRREISEGLMRINETSRVNPRENPKTVKKET